MLVGLAISKLAIYRNCDQPLASWCLYLIDKHDLIRDLIHETRDLHNYISDSVCNAVAIATVQMVA